MFIDYVIVAEGDKDCRALAVAGLARRLEHFQVDRRRLGKCEIDRAGAFPLIVETLYDDNGRTAQVRMDGGKLGTVLGRKGTETRARLLDATRKLLQTVSPFNLTVAAIAKAAKTAPATLYVYFDDVQDVFYALSVEACDDFEEMTRSHPEWFTDRERASEDAQQFVDGFNRVWDRHSHALLYRNLESDRGNARFLDLRTANALPLIERLAVAVRKARPDQPHRESYADAIVLFSSVERLAATRHQFPDDRPQLPSDELSKAQARVIASYLLDGRHPG